MARKAILKTMKIGNILPKAVNFLKEVKLEIKKVNWPTRQETLRYTLVVIGVSLGTAIFLGGIDYILALLRDRFILQ